MENSVTAYRERVKAMRPENLDALLRNHDALVSSDRWLALSQELRDQLSAMVEVVREARAGSSPIEVPVVIEEESNG